MVGGKCTGLAVQTTGSIVRDLSVRSRCRSLMGVVLMPVHEVDHVTTWVQSFCSSCLSNKQINVKLLLVVNCEEKGIHILLIHVLPNHP